MNRNETRILNHIYCFLFFIIVSCRKDETPKPELPQLTTEVASSITASAAVVGGNIISDGGSTITSRGICWSIDPNPVVSSAFKTTEGSGTGLFASTIQNLDPDTKYFARSYAVNGAGTAYGNEISFVTNKPVDPSLLPTVSTADVIYSDGTLASCGGTITADGGYAITARGVCWAQGTTPTLNNFFTTDGAGGGSFSSNLAGLLAGKTYFVRAYATNEKGTSYGISYAFTTRNLPSLATAAVTGIQGFAAISGGEITSDGGSSIIERGICWSNLPDPNLNNSGKIILGSGTGSFSGLMKGLDMNSTYYVRAFAKNQMGISYGNQFSFTTANKIIDIDGNEYQYIQIGSQLWMRENLKVSRYQNGDSIPVSKVVSLYTPGIMGEITPFGKYYNQYAVNEPRGVCPTGMHVPTDADWMVLKNFLGGDSIAGGKLKAVSELWNSPNVGATNESGFSALPGGVYPYSFGNFNFCGFWSTASLWSIYNYEQILRVNVTFLGLQINDPSRGYSVRCLKD